MADSGKRGGPEPIVPLKDGDAFWLTDLYPDAKALFEHEQVSLEAASNECIVVLDANVLLLPFEFSSASVGEVERVYAELCADGRMVVPGQAAREFYKNRSNKITAIADAIDAAITKAKKQIFDKSIPLLENDADYLAARELGKDLVNRGKEVAEKL
jgi:rRNA-processing protein FCF1